MTPTASASADDAERLIDAFAPVFRLALSSKMPKDARAAVSGSLSGALERLRAAGASLEAVEPALRVIAYAQAPRAVSQWDERIGGLLRALGVCHASADPASTLASERLGPCRLGDGLDWEEHAARYAVEHMRTAYESAVARGTSLAPNYVAEWASVGARNAFLIQLRSLLSEPGVADALAAQLCGADAGPAHLPRLRAIASSAGGTLAGLVDDLFAHRLWYAYRRAEKAGVPFAAAGTMLDLFEQRIAESPAS